VSDYSLDDRAVGVRSPAEAKDLSCRLCVRTSSEAHPASYLVDPGGGGGPCPADLVQDIDAAVQADRHMSIAQLEIRFNLCRGSIWDIVHECLNCYSRTVTGDGTWVFHYTPKNKAKSMTWKHPEVPTTVKDARCRLLGCTSRTNLSSLSSG
jgi:hypothetical protein